MATFTISVTNSDFRTNDDYEVADLEAAKRQAVAGALQIGVDQVMRGENFFGAEISIAHDREVLARFLVSVGAAPLQ
jgi:hypothetical protein